MRATNKNVTKPTRKYIESEKYNEFEEEGEVPMKEPNMKLKNEDSKDKENTLIFTHALKGANVQKKSQSNWYYKK